MYKSKTIVTGFIFLLAFLTAGILSAQTQQPFLSLTVMHPDKMLKDIEILSGEVQKPVSGDMILQKITEIFPLDISTIDMSRPFGLLLKDPMAMAAGADKALVLIFTSKNFEGTLQSLGGKSELAGEEKDIYQIFPKEDDGKGGLLYLRKMEKFAVLGSNMLTLKGMDPSDFMKPPAGLKGNLFLRLSLEPVRPMIAMMLPMTKQQTINEMKAAMEKEGMTEEEINQKLGMMESVFGFSEELVAGMKGMDIALDVSDQFLSTQLLFNLNPDNMVSELAAMNAKNTVIPYLKHIDTSAPLVMAMNVALTPKLRDLYFDMVSLMSVSKDSLKGMPEGMAEAYFNMMRNMMGNLDRMKETLTGITAAYSLSFKDGKPYLYEVIGGCSDFNAYRAMTTDMLSDVNQMFQGDFITSERDVKKIGDIAVDRWTINLEGLIDKLPGLIAEAESLKEPGSGEDAESSEEVEEAEEAEEDSEASEAADLEEIKKMVSALTDGKPCEMFIGYSKALAYLSMSPNGMADLERMIKGDLTDKAPDTASLFGPLDSASQVMLRLNVSGFLKQLEGVLLKVMPPEELGEYQEAAKKFEGLPPVYMGKKFTQQSIRGDLFIPRGFLSALSVDTDEEKGE